MRLGIRLVAVALFFSSRTSASAQTGVARLHPRVPVTIALLESPSQGSAPISISRRTTGSDRDVILLASNADAALLSRAVQILLMTRRIEGDTAVQAANIRERPGARDSAPVEYPWAQRVLNDLRAGERRDISGMGRVRAVRIWLPPQRRHR